MATSWVLWPEYFISFFCTNLNVEMLTPSYQEVGCLESDQNMRAELQECNYVLKNGTGKSFLSFLPVKLQGENICQSVKEEGPQSQ